MIQNNVIHESYRAGTSEVVFLGQLMHLSSRMPAADEGRTPVDGPAGADQRRVRAGEDRRTALAQYYARQHGLRVVCPMPCNLYGPNDSFDVEHSHVLSAMVRKFVDAARSGASQVTLWGTGSARREFLHVDDLAAAVLLLMEKWTSPDIVNVGCGNDVTIRELATTIAAKAGFTGELAWDSSMPDGMPRKCLDTSRLAALGFRPVISLEMGIEQMIGDYRRMA